MLRQLEEYAIPIVLYNDYFQLFFYIEAVHIELKITSHIILALCPQELLVYSLFVMPISYKIQNTLL